MAHDPKPSWILLALGLLAGFATVVYFSLAVYRPDRPVATIVPGSSSAPVFVVQIIRPRLGLPLGGLLPPQLFGLEAHLGFGSTSAGASIGSVGPGLLELGADDWDLVLVLDADGRVTAETRVVFELMFEERLRRVRCRPGDPPIGTLSTTALAESGELSGSFDIELARCEYAVTGTPLGWPPEPLVLHGSFDRLPLGHRSEATLSRSSGAQRRGAVSDRFGDGTRLVYRPALEVPPRSRGRRGCDHSSREASGCSYRLQVGR